jgi:hypothetical protein
MKVKSTPKPWTKKAAAIAGSNGSDPADPFYPPAASQSEPAWLGSDLNATVTKVEVVEGPSKKGKQIVLGLGIRVTDSFWAHLPTWLPQASHQDDLDYRMTSCKLSQPKCRIGVTFKGLDPEKGDLKIESCTLQPGLTVKLSIDPKKPEAQACIKLRVDYTQERVKFFGDHMDALVRFKAFSAKSEQQALPMDGKSKAAEAA